MTPCARCRRTVKAPVYIAGMGFGRACAAAVRGAVGQRAQGDQQPAIDPRQRDMFKEIAS